MKKILIVIIFAFLIELIIFNYVEVKNELNSSVQKNIVYNIKDIKKVNWSMKNRKLISNLDPILELENLNTEVKNINIQLKGKNNIPYIDLFWTEEKNEVFNADKIQRINTNIKGNFNQEIKIELNKQVQDLRIDLGDNPGLELDEIKITINYSHIRLNYARIIAMLLIYITSKFLFSLQQNPKYD